MCLVDVKSGANGKASLGTEGLEYSRKHRFGETNARETGFEGRTLSQNCKRFERTDRLRNWGHRAGTFEEGEILSEEKTEKRYICGIVQSRGVESANLLYARHTWQKSRGDSTPLITAFLSDRKAAVNISATTSSGNRRASDTKAWQMRVDDLVQAVAVPHPRMAASHWGIFLAGGAIRQRSHRVV
ncbi:hypothetical protein B0H17DRAFT_1140425 [Mycena rosella]|uniref:Uncharacterized protein n=1 Tax=Mycena rosella TaxID=1033263 RepID=A0AAD7GA64_MYCRO|nr:hypothetical protein B0H17DRAFT_1140425 [Mycena rosella]